MILPHYLTQGDFTHFLWKHCVPNCHSRGCRLGIPANAYSAVKKSDSVQRVTQIFLLQVINITVMSANLEVKYLVSLFGVKSLEGYGEDQSYKWWFFFIMKSSLKILETCSQHDSTNLLFSQQFDSSFEFGLFTMGWNNNWSSLLIL